MHLILQLLLNALLILRCNLQKDLSCGKFQKKVSCKERNEILDVHNRFRQAGALGILTTESYRSLDSVPNMIELIWNRKLADRAESWARKCNFGHDITIGRIWAANPEDTSYRLEINQNMAFVWSHKPGDKARWSRTIQYWFSGIKLDEKEGYFHQIVWANTSAIGCGIEYFKHPKLNYVKIYVCNYAKGGNIRGQYNPKGLAECKRRDLIPSTTYLGLCEKKKVKKEICVESKPNGN